MPYLRTGAFLLAGVLLASHNFESRAADTPANPTGQRQDAAKTERRALADAAQAVWEALRLRLEAGEAMTPSFVEMVCQASRRWCLAEIDDAADDGARDKHVDRIKSFHEMLSKRFETGLDVSRVQIAQAAYFLREAELWAAQASKEKK